MNEKIYILGHKNPDTDTIVSAIATAELLKFRGIDAIPTTQGDINPETKFALEKFEFKKPEVMTSVAGMNIGIVDTTEPEQLPSDLDEASIKIIIDHHKLSGLKTSTPVEIYSQPVGSTATVIFNIFKSEGRILSKNLAGLLMCAILSDTILFKSPTTTDWDKFAIVELGKIAGIDDYEKLGLEMLKIKSDISNETIDSLIFRDFKECKLDDATLMGVGQIELIDSSLLNPKLPELMEKLSNLKKLKNYHSVIFIVTDIMKEGSYLIIFSDELTRIEKIFNTTINDNKTQWLQGFLSRKKQLIPPLINEWK